MGQFVCDWLSIDDVVWVITSVLRLQALMDGIATDHC